MRTGFLLAAVLLSGAAGLMYQTLWIRKMGFIFGNTTISISLVLSSFFFGLAAGGLWIGKRADRTGSPLRLYALLELGIAFSAFLVWAALPFLDDVYVYLYRSFLGQNLLAVNALKFGLTFGLLALPTILMGGTLPVIARCYVRRVDQFAASLGLVYAVNTVGAFFGLMLMAFILIECLGLRGAYSVSLICSLLSAGLARAAVPGTQREALVVAEAEEAPSGGGPPAADPRGALRLLYGLSFVTGGIGLGYEVLWIRLWSFISLHSDKTPIGRAPAELSSTYVFSVILGMFLVGISLGGALVSKLGPGKPLLRLSRVQALIGVYTLLTLAAEQMLYLDGLGWKLFEVAMVVLPTTVLMGIAFPLLASAFVTAPGTMGDRFGRFYAVNALGCSVGPLLVGMVLVPQKGTYFCLAFFGIANLAIAFLLRLESSERGRRHRLRALAAVVSVLIGCLFVPVPHSLFRSYGEGVKVLFEEDNHVGHSLLLEYPGGGKSLVINNYAVSSRNPGSPFGDLSIQLPVALMGRPPKDILVLCVGAGNSLKSSLSYDASVVAVDINPAVFQCLPMIHTPEVAQQIRSGRVQEVVNDARNFLMLHDQYYDIINIDPAPPITQPGMVSLHTREFYELAKARLKPGGVLFQRFSMNVDSEILYKALLRSIADVFQDVTVWDFIGGGLDIVASDRQLSVLHGGPELISDEMFARAHRYFLCGREEVAVYTNEVPAVTDDMPVLEYHLLLRWAAARGEGYPWDGPRHNRDEIMGLTRPMAAYIRREPASGP